MGHKEQHIVAFSPGREMSFGREGASKTSTKEAKRQKSSCEPFVFFSILVLDVPMLYLAARSLGVELPIALESVFAKSTGRRREQ